MVKSALIYHLMDAHRIRINYFDMKAQNNIDLTNNIWLRQYVIRQDGNFLKTQLI